MSDKFVVVTKFINQDCESPPLDKTAADDLRTKLEQEYPAFDTEVKPAEEKDGKGRNR